MSIQKLHPIDSVIAATSQRELRPGDARLEDLKPGEEFYYLENGVLKLYRRGLPLIRDTTIVTVYPLRGGHKTRLYSHEVVTPL